MSRLCLLLLIYPTPVFLYTLVRSRAGRILQSSASFTMYSQTLVVPTLRVSSPLSPRSVPSICISPADPPVQPDSPVEPTSPEDALSPRSTYLLPPPVRSPVRRTLSSPTKAMDKKGLDQSTFQDLLMANRERAARRSVNAADRLRREVVVKAHHSKQRKQPHFSPACRN